LRLAEKLDHRSGLLCGGRCFESRSFVRHCAPD
jgi:hypothetical protein